MALFSFLKRAFIGDQTTARLALQQSQGYAFSDVQGNGGHNYIHSIAATSPAGITPGPTHKLNDPSVTGNDSYTLGVSSLTDDRAL